MAWGPFAARWMIVCGPHLACPPKAPTRHLLSRVKKSLASLASSLPRQHLLHPPSRTAACQLADRRAGKQAAIPDVGCKRCCLGRELASETRLSLTLDSRGCVGASGGAGKVGAANCCLAGHKWPPGRMFETPALAAVSYTHLTLPTKA